MTQTVMLEASCHCGAVQIFPGTPEYIIDCNCCGGECATRRASIFLGVLRRVLAFIDFSAEKYVDCASPLLCRTADDTQMRDKLVTQAW